MKLGSAVQIALVIRITVPFSDSYITIDSRTRNLALTMSIL
jgi:hypothetical protein